MRACCTKVRAALAAIVLCCCVSVAQAQRLPPVSEVVSAGYAPNLLPPAGETKFFGDYTQPPKPPEAVACGWNEVAGEDFDEFGTWWDNTLVSVGGEAFNHSLTQDRLLSCQRTVPAWLAQLTPHFS